MRFLLPLALRHMTQATRPNAVTVKPTRPSAIFDLRQPLLGLATPMKPKAYFTRALSTHTDSTPGEVSNHVIIGDYSMLFTYHDLLTRSPERIIHGKKITLIVHPALMEQPLMTFEEELFKQKTWQDPSKEQFNATIASILSTVCPDLASFHREYWQRYLTQHVELTRTLQNAGFNVIHGAITNVEIIGKNAGFILERLNMEPLLYGQKTIFSRTDPTPTVFTPLQKVIEDFFRKTGPRYLIPQSAMLNTPVDIHMSPDHLPNLTQAQENSLNMMMFLGLSDPSIKLDRLKTNHPDLYKKIMEQGTTFIIQTFQTLFKDDDALRALQQKGFHQGLALNMQNIDTITNKLPPMIKQMICEYGHNFSHDLVSLSCKDKVQIINALAKELTTEKSPETAFVFQAPPN